jgi:hypothetical protein
MLAPQPASSIEQLALSLYHRDSPEALFMVMTGYFDESGTHGAGSPLTTVAGFLATAEQWGGYERDFGQLLADFGVETFHANARFLRLADDHLSCGMAMILRAADYANIYRVVQFPRRARPDTEYGLCVRAALWKTIVFMKDRPQDWPVNIVLESGHRNAEDALRVFNETKASLLPQYAPMLRALTFESKDDCYPLAMADSLAYAIFRMSAGYSRHPTEPNAAVVGPADPPYYVNKIPLSRTLIDENTLASLRDGLCREERRRVAM